MCRLDLGSTRVDVRNTEGFTLGETHCGFGSRDRWTSRITAAGRRLRARIEHGDRPAVLRPAGNVVADRDRPFLAVGDRTHPIGIHPAGGEVIMHGMRASR